MSYSHGIFICKENSFDIQGNGVFIRGNMFSYKEMNYLYEPFIQGAELFIQILHTRKGVIHIQGNEFFIYKEMSCS
jgi:hypothetical protein